MDRESVGAKIKALRQSRGLKGKDLADRTGLSAAAISKFENGLLRPTDTLIDAVVKALDLTSKEAKESTCVEDTRAPLSLQPSFFDKAIYSQVSPV